MSLRLNHGPLLIASDVAGRSRWRENIEGTFPAPYFNEFIVSFDFTVQIPSANVGILRVVLFYFKKMLEHLFLLNFVGFFFRSNVGAEDYQAIENLIRCVFIPD